MSLITGASLRDVKSPVMNGAIKINEAQLNIAVHKIFKNKDLMKDNELLIALVKMDDEYFKYLQQKDIFGKSTVSLTFSLYESERTLYRNIKKARIDLVKQMGIKKIEELSGIKITY